VYEYAHPKKYPNSQQSGMTSSYKVARVDTATGRLTWARPEFLSDKRTERKLLMSVGGRMHVTPADTTHTGFRRYPFVTLDHRARLTHVLNLGVLTTTDDKSAWACMIDPAKAGCWSLRVRTGARDALYTAPVRYPDAAQFEPRQDVQHRAAIARRGLDGGVYMWWGTASPKLQNAFNNLTACRGVYEWGGLTLDGVPPNYYVTDLDVSRDGKLLVLAARKQRRFEAGVPEEGPVESKMFFFDVYGVSDVRFRATFDVPAQFLSFHPDGTTLWTLARTTGKVDALTVIDLEV
jgi:hypothetical protein